MKTLARKICLLATALSLLGFAPGSTAQTLTHRYSFNDTAGNPTFADSIGGASWDGTLIGSAALDGSKLQLDGLGGFATLPASLISSYMSVSIEFWISYSTNNPVWTRTIAFGDQNGSGNQRTGLDYTHFAGGNFQNLGLSTTNANVWANNPGGLNGQSNVHVTLVVDPAGNRMFYYNGTAVASNPGVNNGAVPALSGINDTTCLIGKSLFDVDALLEASIDELRIYQGLITPAQLALNDAAGPNNFVTDPGAIQSVNLISPANPLVPNQNSQQIFTGNFANVSGVNLSVYGGATFTSGNTNVLTVNPTNGLVRGVSVGTTTVVASYGGLSKTNSLTVVSIPATLAHRYSFTSDATDSVGAAHGTLMGAATISGGKAVLDGTVGTYVDLPGGLVNIAGKSSVTIEAWIDFGDVPNFCRVFNFGNDGGSSEIYLAPKGFGNGNNNHALSQNIAGGRFTEWRGAFRNLSLHLTVVMDPLTGTMAIYKDGVLEYARYDATAPLSLISTNLAVIGRSLVGVDPYMPGSIDEFRIYNGALSAQEIALTHQNGPGSVTRDPGALNSISVQSAIYPAFSGVLPPVVLANYANLSNFVLQTNNSAVVNGYTITSSATNVVLVRANNMLQTFRPGTSVLTASYLGQTNSATVTVQNIGALAHRYSFTSDATDSVGTAHGALQGTANVAGGNLVLDGTAGNYVELPPGLLEGYKAVTVDAWVTFNAAPSWTRLWFFGDDRQNEFYFSPSFNNATVHSLQAGFPINGGSRNPTPILENRTLHVTCVYGNGFIGIYTNGILESSSSSNQGRMDQIGSLFSWIGRSPYNNPFMNCSIDEFRIYRGRLAPDEIQASDVIGPGQLLSTSATMSAGISGGSTILTWPVAAAGFSVQTKLDLSSGNWVTLTNAPTLVSGNWQVSVPATNGAQFFRLWK